MAMPLYRISVSILSKQLKSEIPGPMQFWYAYDSSATASGRATRPLIQRLGGLGLSWGVFPEVARSQYILPEQAPEATTELATSGTTLRHKYGKRSLGGYIGSRQVQNSWVKYQTSDWAHGVTALGKIAMRFPQTAYDVPVKSLQNEWNYL